MAKSKRKSKKSKSRPRLKTTASLNPTDPTFEPWNKGTRLPPEVLSEDETRTLIRVCSNRPPTGIRNRALITVLWRAQLRVSEALALTPKDVDRSEGKVRVLHGKGDVHRTVGLDDGTLAILDRWLDKRKQLGISTRGKRPLFCTLDGGPLSPAYVRAMLKRMAKRAGIEKRVHPHGLRHTGAAELRGEGVDIGIISKQLGHSSIATTARYLDHIAPEQVVETMRKRQ